MLKLNKFTISLQITLSPNAYSLFYREDNNPPGGNSIVIVK